MRSATIWFDMYAESHLNPTNKAIHWVCIPLILLACLGLVASIPHPFGGAGLLNWATLAWAGCMVFYARLSWTIAVGMAAIGGLFIAFNAALVAAGLNLVAISVAIFVGAWIAQFVGHKIEGKKPSFFQDLQFLLVGPAWLLQFIYKRAGVPVETWKAAGA